MVPPKPLPTERMLSFVKETETAVVLLDEGIRIIEAHNGVRDRRIVALLLTGQGFERFLKLTRAQIVLSRTGHFPSVGTVKDWGHRLLGLLDDTLAELATDDSFTARPAIRDDLNFLREDTRFRALFTILDEFATCGRYHNLDVLLDGQSKAQDPLRRWDEYTLELFREDPIWVQLMKGDPAAFSRAWHPYLAAEQTRMLQRAARALTRAWTLGPAQEPGKRLTGVISRFLFLADDRLHYCPERS